MIFLYFHNFVAKSDQKPKTKNGMNETIESHIKGGFMSEGSGGFSQLPKMSAEKNFLGFKK